MALCIVAYSPGTSTTFGHTVDSNDGALITQPQLFATNTPYIPTSVSAAGKIFNVSPVALTAAVEIFTADGQEAPGDSSFTVDLEPFDMTQLNDVLNRLPAGERQGLIIRVGITSAEGAILAYLSEVDNTTNDASYQEGFRFSF